MARAFTAANGKASAARRAILLAPHDNVAVAITNLAAGSAVEIEGRRIETRDPIELGHKLAVVAIAAGTQVTKFGVPIGVATVDIAPGAHVHIHNIKSTYLTNDVDHFE